MEKESLVICDWEVDKGWTWEIRNIVEEDAFVMCINEERFGACTWRPLKNLHITSEDPRPRKVIQLKLF